MAGFARTSGENGCRYLSGNCLEQGFEPHQLIVILLAGNQLGNAFAGDELWLWIYIRSGNVWCETPYLKLQSPLFISMRWDRHPYAYKTFMLVGRVDLSHINLVGTRAGMLVEGLCLYTVCL